MGITIYDVAAGAQVSPATVSRVLAGGGSVAPDTADRVRQVIERLGYRPDRVAQSLRRQRSGTVGLVIPIDEHPGSREIVSRASEDLAQKDVTMMLGAYRGTSAASVVSRLISQRVDGLIFVRTRTGVEVPDPNDIEVPVVALDCGHTDTEVDSVRIDHEAGTRQAVRYALGEGAERLVYLGEGTASVIGSEQIAGFAAATADAPLSAALRLGPPTAQFALTELDRLMGLADPPDALICGSDTIAATVDRRLHRGQDQLPLVVGYGGAPLLQVLVPGGASVRLPVAEAVDETIRALEQRLLGYRGVPLSVSLPPSLAFGEFAPKA